MSSFQQNCFVCLRTVNVYVDSIIFINVQKALNRLVLTDIACIFNELLTYHLLSDRCFCIKVVHAQSVRAFYY